MNKHYALSISDTKTLKNGYRFIKEAILQNHNHEKLKQNDIQVYSVKTDAFVIDKCNLGKATSLLSLAMVLVHYEKAL